MKNFISVLIFGALLTITACQKDLEVVQSSTKNTQTSSKNVKPDAALSLEVTKQADCYYGVYVDNGMLAFSDANHFKSVLECLEQQVQANNQAFADQYPNLSDDDFTNVLENQNSMSLRL